MPHAHAPAGPRGRVVARRAVARGAGAGVQDGGSDALLRRGGGLGPLHSRHEAQVPQYHGAGPWALFFSPLLFFFFFFGLPLLPSFSFSPPTCPLEPPLFGVLGALHSLPLRRGGGGRLARARQRVRPCPPTANPGYPLGTLPHFFSQRHANSWRLPPPFLPCCILVPHPRHPTATTAGTYCTSRGCPSTT